MTVWDVIVLSFIEGVTEFLPISSTGHLIIVAHFLDVIDKEFVKNFNIIIQFGAILAVLAIYWDRFFKNFKFYKILVTAVLPAVVIGFLIKDSVDAILGSTLVVGVALIVGGIILIWSDRFFLESHSRLKIEHLSVKNAFMIGLVQCFAFIPGVSRAASAILGGMVLGLNRKEATEFSFFLAVPTLTGAMVLKLYKVIPSITSAQVNYLVIGLVLSFFFAFISIKILIKLVSTHGFKYFGIYRILLGFIVLYFTFYPI